GVDTTDIGTLFTLAGHDAEAFEHGFGHMNRFIGELRAGSKEATEVIERMGLNARALGEMQPVNAFKNISGALHGMTNAYDRAADAQKIFGRGALEAMTVFTKGPEG